MTRPHTTALYLVGAKAHPRVSENCVAGIATLDCGVEARDGQNSQESFHLAQAAQCR
jgi:hypothetical protein